jgi:citrate lyase subunit beta/citryl-CoA lyase
MDPSSPQPALEGTCRRACLTVPASSDRVLEKAVDIAVDELVVDLEDSVAAAAKESARDRLGRWGERLAAGGAAIAVRVNPPRSRWCHLDFEAVAGAGPVASIVLPKVESAGDVGFADRLLDGIEARAGRDAPIRLQALIETAAGLAAVEEIATASDRLDGLVLGYADLAASLGRRPPAADADLWRATQDRLLVAARANGLEAIDGPFFDLAEEAELRRHAELAAAMGFDGKWAIHPRQVEPITEAFTPSAAEAERARSVLAALERAGSETGAGAAALDGEMVDEAMAVAARRLLRRLGELR